MLSAFIVRYEYMDVIGWYPISVSTEKGNLYNGAVITLVSNYLIGPFVFVFSLIDLS